MYSGGCLCDSVRFEVDDIIGPFELCHCSRCRKSSGSSHAAMVGVNAAGYRITKGSDLIKTVVLDLIDKPPEYAHSFCCECGSPVTTQNTDAGWLEVPAGLFDDEIPISPDKHICVDMKPEWDKLTDKLPVYTKLELMKLRLKR